MRYLFLDEIEDALHRGKSVEQFLGAGAYPDSVRWVELRPRVDQVEVWIFEVEDLGGPDFLDLYEFTATGTFEDAPVAMVASATEAMKYISTEFGATSNKWLNEAVIQDEYARFKA